MPSNRNALCPTEPARPASTGPGGPEVVEAASEWRVHRIGQTRPVPVRLISLVGSVNEAIAGVLRHAMRLLAQTLD